MVEGYLDVIALAQHDIAYAVATLGTALTADHLRVLVALHQKHHRALRRRRCRAKSGGAQFRDFRRSRPPGTRGLFAQERRSRHLCAQPTAKPRWKLFSIKRCRWRIIIFLGWNNDTARALEGQSQSAGEISRVLAKVTNPFEVDLLVRRAVDILGIREEILRRPRRAPVGRPAQPRARPRAARRSGAKSRRRGGAFVGELMLRYPAALFENLRKTRSAPMVQPQVGAEVVDVIVAEWQEHGEIDVLRIAQRSRPERACEIAALPLKAKRSMQPNAADGRRIVLTICGENISRASNAICASRFAPRKNKKMRKPREKGS